MPDPHHNCFYYYRGPSALHDEPARNRQIEDNTTKALINVLEYSERQLTASFLAAVAELTIDHGKKPAYYLQGAPNPAQLDERRLVAISRLSELSGGVDESSQKGPSRPDAAIHVPEQALVVFEVKLDLNLDLAQLRHHAHQYGLDLNHDLRTVTWTEIYDWAERELGREHDSVTAFLLAQFIRYLELQNLSPFAGMRAGDFDFFVSPTADAQQEVKARLEALWQAIAVELPEPQRKALEEFHVGALGLHAPNAWAQTNWRQNKINLTLEMTDQEIWFNIVGWQDKRARRLVNWLRTEQAAKRLSQLRDYELVSYRRRCGNWANRKRARTAWWRHETYEVAQRYPAPQVPRHLEDLYTWINSLRNPWEKPGFHLRKTWTRKEAIAAGRTLVTQVAPEASKLVPILDEINAL